MILEYLEDEFIGSDVLDLRESDDFNKATIEANKRDVGHPDELNWRFDIVSDPQILWNLTTGFSIFQEHQVDWFNLERYLQDLQSQVPEYQEIFLKIWRALHISNESTISSALVVNGWPVEELQQRTRDSVCFIREQTPDIIIASWGKTDISRKLWVDSEAEYLMLEMQKQWIERDFTLENRAQNTGENAKLVSKLLWNTHFTTIVTTDYDSLRGCYDESISDAVHWDKKNSLS